MKPISDISKFYLYIYTFQSPSGLIRLRQRRTSSISKHRETRNDGVAQWENIQILHLRRDVGEPVV